MKAILTCDVEFTVVTGLGQDNEPLEEIEVFRAGAQLEFDVIDHPLRMQNGSLEPDHNFWNIQFGNGSMVFGAAKEWFKVVDN